MSNTLATNMIKALIEDLGPDCFMSALTEAITDNDGRVFEFSGYRKPNEYEMQEILKAMTTMSAISLDIENY